jgi:hypothetical protein
VFPPHVIDGRGQNESILEGKSGSRYFDTQPARTSTTVLLTVLTEGSRQRYTVSHRIVSGYSRCDASPIRTILPLEMTDSSRGPPNKANSSQWSGASMMVRMVSQ